MIAIKQAFDQWSAEIKPIVIEQYSADDEVALSESWNAYTDSLCEDGELCALQYHYAPSWDDEMPDDDREFILDAMGLRMSATRINERPNGNDGWASNASHWRILLQRHGAEYTTHYSMGSAHTSEPDMPGVLWCLLSDTGGVDGTTFEDWAADYGFDTDSRKAERMYKACQDTAAHLPLLFNPDELHDLRALFEDY